MSTTFDADLEKLRARLAVIRSKAPRARSTYNWRMDQTTYDELMERYYLRGESVIEISTALKFSENSVRAYVQLIAGTRFELPAAVRQQLLELEGSNGGDHE